MHVLTVMSLPTTVYVVSRAFDDLGIKAQREIGPSYYASLVYTALAVVCWIVDRAGCNTIKEKLGWYPQLHAWWHIFIFCSAWLVAMSCLFITAELEGVVSFNRPLDEDDVRLAPLAKAGCSVVAGTGTYRHGLLAIGGKVLALSKLGVYWQIEERIV
jgi:hypothetical protein